MDRNVPGQDLVNGIRLSLSARRAWIEIYNISDIEDKFGVALRKESVDRNPVVPVELTKLVSRSPQGERG